MPDQEEISRYPLGDFDAIEVIKGREDLSWRISLLQAEEKCDGAVLSGVVYIDSREGAYFAVLISFDPRLFLVYKLTIEQEIGCHRDIFPRVLTQGQVVGWADHIG